MALWARDLVGPRHRHHYSLAIRLFSCNSTKQKRETINKAIEMTQTTNRFLDEIARLMNDAAGVASGVRREVDTVFRNQADRILHELDVVKREEFEAVKDMARIAREENEALKARIAALEAKVGTGGVG
jgi:BMFP domain-containing protein YqiC